MNYNTFTNGLVKIVPILKDIAKYKCLVLNDMQIKVQSHIGCLSITNKFLKGLAKQTSMVIETYLLSRVIGGGPKVFRPTGDQFHALEQMTINLDISDYAQPFETIVIEVPNYESVEQPVDTLYGVSLAATHRPCLSIVHWNGSVLLTSVVFDSRISIKQSFAFTSSRIIEEELTKQYEVFVDSLETSRAETEIAQRIIRASLNYCLLLDEIGVQRIGYNNPKHVQRLVSRSESTRQIPVFYDLKQEVQLRRIVQTTSELPVETGRIMRPHHRRGFYRMQPHGPGLSLRKRIRVHPVFVNAKLFAGDLSATTYVGVT